MTTKKGRPATGRPSSEAPAKKPQRQHSDGDPQAAAGELLRQLAREVLDATEPADARERLRVAAVTLAGLIAAGQVDRAGETTALYLAGQAVGIGQADALDVLRDAGRRAGGR